MSVFVALSLVSSVVAQTNVTLNFSRIPADVISFHGDAGTAYVIQVSTNLVDWTNLVQLVASGDGFHTYTNFPTTSQLFYRSESIPNVYNGQVQVSFDPSSPAVNLIQISTSAQTMNVLLAIFDVKSQNTSGTLQSLTLTINTAGASFNSLVNNVQIRADGLTYGASSISSNGVVVFNNLSIPLSSNTVVPVSVRVDIAQDTGNLLDGSSAYVTMTCSGSAGGSSNNPYVIDQNYYTEPVASVTVAGNTQIFTAGVVSLNGLIATQNSPVINSQTGAGVESFTFTYTATAGDNPIYISKTGATALTLSTNGVGNVSIVSFVPSNGIQSWDGTNYYQVPPGMSRTFTMTGSVSGNAGSVGVNISVTSVNYGLSSGSPASNSITYGLSALSVNVSF